MLRAITARTRLIFITNPNNPTGQLVEPDAILEIAAATPAATIFVDEAYADFSGRSLLDGATLDRHRNLIVGRTFAKAYGLAALRVGAVVGCPQALAPLRRVLPPYNLNICAAVALRAGLEDAEHYEWYLEQVRSSKELLYRTLDRLNVPYWKSAANFVLADFRSDASRVVAGLVARDIHVRDKSRDPLCPGCLRITAGVVEHTKACIAALEEVLCGAAS